MVSLGLQAGALQAGDALVTTDPARLEIGQKQIKTMRILLENAHDIYGIDLQARFDPDVVEVVDADSRQAGVQMISGTFIKPDFTILNLADNKAGTLRYVVTQLNPTLPANGKGTLLSIQFRGKDSVASSKLTFTSVVIADRNGTRQPVATRAADLIILRPISPTPTPLPGGYFVTAVPTWSAPTLTQVRSQPTVTASLTATQISPATQTSAIVSRFKRAWIPERNQATPEQVRTYVIVGGLSGAIVLSGLSVWIVTAKRRKNKIAKTRRDGSASSQS